PCDPDEREWLPANLWRVHEIQRVLQTSRQRAVVRRDGDHEPIRRSTGGAPCPHNRRVLVLGTPIEQRQRPDIERLTRRPALLKRRHRKPQRPVCRTPGAEASVNSKDVDCHRAKPTRSMPCPPLAAQRSNARLPS